MLNDSSYSAVQDSTSDHSVSQSSDTCLMSEVNASRQQPLVTKDTATSCDNQSKINKDFGTVELVDSSATAAKPTDAPASTNATANQSIDAPASTSSDKPSGPPAAGDQKTADASPATVATVSPAEQGEFIKRDVAPSVTGGGKGDTLEKVARDHLGPNATDDEVKAHEKEIARINGIKDMDKPLDGKPLFLPGHTADGGFVTQDADGNKRTIWHDGVVRVENADHTGYVRKPDGNGGVSEHHWGPKPQDNVDLIKGADGIYKICDGPNDKVGHAPKDDNEKLIAEKAHLTDAADTKIADPKERARFHKDMQDLDDRMQHRAETQKELIDERVKKGELKPEEAEKLKAAEDKKATEQLAETYQNTARLLESSDHPKLPLKEQDRTVIAEQIIHQAAHPDTIDQGYHNTCNVATVESRLYTDDPGKAAKLVADVATTGSYDVPGPPATTVHVDTGSLKADPQARINPPIDGQRSYASQIFEVTAVNIPYAIENAQSGGKQDIRYEQHQPGRTPDTGERLMDYTKHPPVEITDENGKPKRQPDLSEDQIVKAAQQIGGPIDGKDLYLTTDPSGKDTDWIGDEKRLNTELARLKKEGKLPAIIKVHSDNYPFHSDGGEDAGGKGAWHVVTVTDYIPGNPPRVALDNQWGSDSDHQGNKAVTAHDLFEAMRDPNDKDHLKDIKADVEADRAKGNVDVFKETELLRLERRNHTLTDKQLADEEFRLTMHEARQIYKGKQEGTLTDEQKADFQKAMNELRDLRSTLTPAEQKAFNDRLAKQFKQENIDFTKK